MSARPLTARTVASLAPTDRPVYHHDTIVPGLSLRVGPAATGGTTSWSVRYRVGRAQRRLTLGKYPTLSLADARDLARDALKTVAASGDPALTKQERRHADTFADFVPVYLERHAKVKKRSWKVDQSVLTRQVVPHWRHLLMKDITRRHVRDLLEEIAARPAPIVANRVRALLHKLFNVAIEREVVEVNPVTRTSRPGVECRRDRVLTDDELRVFWATTEAMPLAMRAGWQLRLLTAQRGGEVYAMRWADLDLVGRWWTIPAAHAKNGKSHRVPLSPTVVALLTDLRTAEDVRFATQRERDPDAVAPPFVLRHGRGKRQQAASAATFAIADFCGHDLRRTAASMMASLGTSIDVLGKILNHSESRNVTMVYNRHSYDLEKRAALDAWARHVDAIVGAQTGGHVLPFAR